jgi:hypothetical protein
MDSYLLLAAISMGRGQPRITQGAWLAMESLGREDSPRGWVRY